MANPKHEQVNYVRRRDRAVEDDAWIVEFLQRAAVGTTATAVGDQPFVNTNLFVYDAERDCIYIHTAMAGRTRSNFEQPEPVRVCFSVMEMGRLLPADEALEFSVEYAGVAVFGTGCVIEDDAEATEALQLLLDKYAPHLIPGEDYRPPVVEELRRTTVMRIDIESWSGKKKEVGDFEGAYWYAAPSILASVRARNAK
ncbi:MAG: pyridoxamine 5'-phosphate oxidase family protein [Chloroflexi bacterium]|nr:pyridoxamine 5'-phosphate oxidase family protein [Chloroflexota bacterium]